MEQELPYDKTSPSSIEQYAQQLLGKSLKDVLGQNTEQTYKGKGKLGQLLEELYFHYAPNSIAGPDFAEAGVELKTTPVKKTSKGLVSKERLVFNIIDYCKEHELEFKDSSFWKKNSLLLLLFYLYTKDKSELDYIFKIARLWQFPPTDLKIIKDDWEKIITKIKNGKAHELSEGDTLYLGACTKGANKNSVRKQPFSDINARQRAFSLKSKYLNYIIKSSFAREFEEIDYSEYDKILGIDSRNEKNVYYQKIRPESYESIVKSIDAYEEGETFEDIVIKKFSRYYEMSETDLIQHLKIPKTNAKSKFFLISKAILGITNEKIAEFEKADILLKTIRLEKTGTLKESMSFAQIKYTEIINEEWEESYWHETLTKRFFFVIFQKDYHGILRLKKVMFWNMPPNHLEIAESFWIDTRDKIINEDFKHFIKISDNRICHVRPKGTNARDMMVTHTGKMEKKKCFWLNASYIKSIISS